MRSVPLVVMTGFAVSIAAGACSDQAGDAIERGDRMYGHGRLDASISDYLFALRQEAVERALQRLGIAYGARGDIETSRRYYVDLLERDSSFRYQVAAGLSAAAARAPPGRWSRCWSLERG